MAGYSGTPLVRKLGIKQGCRMGTVHPPAHLKELLSDLPPGVSVETATAEAGPFDVILLFARDCAALDATLPGAIAELDSAGGLWIAWPKKASAMETDLDREGVRAAGLATGLVDNKVCALDRDWSGLRFVYRLRDRGGC